VVARARVEIGADANAVVVPSGSLDGIPPFLGPNVQFADGSLVRQLGNVFMRYEHDTGWTRVSDVCNPSAVTSLPTNIRVPAR
jgi:hypothetical protein